MQQKISPFLPKHTAGKITVATALSGLLVFVFFFVINIGKQELQKVEAQTDGAATTTLTVLNTPPVWVPGLQGREETESSTTTPTNSGNEIAWIGTATDSNNDPYFLIVCSENATPTPGFAPSALALGTVPPTCNPVGGGTQWAVSTSTLSGQEARAATTTTEAAPFGQVNDWYAWVCDDDPVNARCSNEFSQGTNATNSAPFFVNPRPTFTAFSNDGPVDPGDTLTFISTSSDAYTPINADIFLMVCSANTYNPATNECGPGDFLASTTASFKNDTQATLVIDIPTQDATYDAYGYVFDQFGHSATGGVHGTNVQFIVANVAPTIAPGDIILNGGLDLDLTIPGGETTGFTLEVIVSDANSCVAIDSNPEISGIEVALLRSGVGTTTCNPFSGTYDATSCYHSGVNSAVWNLNCTASTTSCTGPTDETILFECSFPLWYVADPTDATSAFPSQNWVAAVSGVDNNNATGTLTIGGTGVNLTSFIALDLLTSIIAYENLEPGQAMPNLTATTTLQVLGNTGLDQELGGDSMCGTYSPGNPCPVSATSTIPESEQRFATSAVAYASGISLTPTSTPTTLNIQIPKPTATSTPTAGVTYWGIAVPSTINLSGLYTGQNTFFGILSNPSTW